MRNPLYLFLGFLFPGTTFFAIRDYPRGLWFSFFTVLPFVLGVLILQSADPLNSGFLNWFRTLLSAPIDASGAISYVILNILRLIFILYPLAATIGLFGLGILIDYLGISTGLSSTLYKEIGTCFCISAGLLNILVLLSAYDALREKK